MSVIKTNIKYSKSPEGKLYGFVVKSKDGSWRGVREDCKDGKKIVLIDPMVEKDIQPNLLYHSLLVPMNNDKGFICLNASLIKFTAKIKSFNIPEHKYFRVEVHFGQKVIKYDPSSKNKKINNMQSIADMLRKREDLRDPMTVADMFLDAATVALACYKREKGG